MGKEIPRRSRGVCPTDTDNETANLFRPTQLTQQTTRMYIAHRNANALHRPAENGGSWLACSRRKEECSTLTMKQRY